MKNYTYSFDDIWNAYAILNPKMPLDRDRLHVISMTISNIIADSVAKQKYADEKVSNEWQDALDLLVSAYWDLMQYGHFKVSEDD